MDQNFSIGVTPEGHLRIRCHSNRLEFDVDLEGQCSVPRTTSIDEPISPGRLSVQMCNQDGRVSLGIDTVAVLIVPKPPPPPPPPRFVLEVYPGDEIIELLRPELNAEDQKILRLQIKSSLP
jgi:hypothetical protein